MTKSTNSYGGLIALFICGYLVYAGVAAIGSGAYSMYKQNQQYYGVSREAVERDRERNFKVLCPSWNNATLFEKYTKYRGRTWCKDFIHRL